MQSVALADASAATETDLDRKAHEVIQRVMVDTLRGVEAPLAMMDEHQAGSDDNPVGGSGAGRSARQDGR